MMSVKKYRLKLFDEVVGFKKSIGSYTFYSKDLYGWSGNRIKHNAIEIETALANTGGKPIFENDVIAHRTKNGTCYLHCKSNPKGDIIYLDLLSGKEVSRSVLDPHKNKEVIFTGTRSSRINLSLLKAFLK